MATNVLEGTWEDMVKKKKKLQGKRLRVEILSDTIGSKREPNRGMLEALERIRERQKDMAPTGGESGVDIIRRGRAGEMFGYEPTE